MHFILKDDFCRWKNFDSWREVKVWLYFGGWVRVRTVLDTLIDTPLCSTIILSMPDLILFFKKTIDHEVQNASMFSTLHAGCHYCKL